MEWSIDRIPARDPKQPVSCILVYEYNCILVYLYTCILVYLLPKWLGGVRETIEYFYDEAHARTSFILCALGFRACACVHTHRQAELAHCDDRPVLLVHNRQAELVHCDDRPVLLLVYFVLGRLSLC